MKIWLSILLFFIAILTYGQSPLCPSTSTSFCCEYVASITINGQTYAGNTGFSGPGYYDYTGTPVPDINAGDLINISYTVRTNGNYRQYFKFWFDFNGNGVLTDPGELVLDETAIINNTTQTFNQTFTVPTDVFNGEVYMRFIMVFSSSPTICGNYAYGNTFDFKTNITGAIDLFNYSGRITDKDLMGVESVPVKLFTTNQGGSNYSLHSSYLTDSNGDYQITTNLLTNIYDFKIIIESPNSPNINQLDIDDISDIVLQQNPSSIDYYRYDINNNDLISISDVYLMHRKIVGGTWLTSTPSHIYLTPIEWDNVLNSSSNLTSTQPGFETITIANAESGGVSNYILIRVGKIK